jgi:hypothetical protein
LILFCLRASTSLTTAAVLAPTIGDDAPDFFTCKHAGAPPSNVGKFNQINALSIQYQW